MEAGDRFIPSTASSSAYRSTTNGSVINESLPLLPSQSPTAANISVREDILYLRPGSGNRDGASPRNSSDSPSIGEHPHSPQKHLARALDLDMSPKVLRYSSPSRSSSSRADILDIAGPLVSTTPSKQVVEVMSTMKPGSPCTAKKPKTYLMASNILQAPGLRNDYYSNLVSWSKKSNRVAVGLGTRVYWWGAENSVRQVPLLNRSMVTAVSAHSQGYLLVAVVGGTIFLVDEATNVVVDTYHHPHGTVFCFQWKSAAKVLFAGDEEGNVTVFKVTKKKLRPLSTLKCVQQQVCGIVLNEDESQMAVGSNNNCCMIWDIKNPKSPVMLYMLPHNAAVKALAYCPWSTSLLATGAGSRDRKIRFWHTRSGTLLSEIQTDAQITALVWSKFKKEIVATSGFGSTDSPVILSVYAYPSMVSLREVPAVPNLRILSSTTSPDNTSLCVAANDYTIRMYKLWEITHELSSKSDSDGAGNYGSALIELREGVAKRGVTIR